MYNNGRMDRHHVSRESRNGRDKKYFSANDIHHFSLLKEIQLFSLGACFCKVSRLFRVPQLWLYIRNAEVLSYQTWQSFWFFI